LAEAHSYASGQVATVNMRCIAVQYQRLFLTITNSTLDVGRWTFDVRFFNDLGNRLF
jgi:hypothetical protein